MCRTKRDPSDGAKSALVQDRNPSVGIDVSEGGDGDADREGERLPEHCAAGV